MAYDSRTDRAKKTWEKKSERGRRYNETKRETRSWENARRNDRWAEFS